MAFNLNWFNQANLATGAYNIFGTIFWIALIIVLLILVGVLVWFLVYQRKFNVKCRILSQREGESGKYLEDLGAYMTRRDGSRIFRIKKEKADIPQPDFKFLIPQRKGNVIFLRQTGPKVFVPVLPSEVFGDKNNPNVKITPADIAFWENTAHQRAKNMYFKPGFWSSPLGGMTIILAVGIILFLLWYMTLKEGQSYIGSMAQIAQAFKEVSANNCQAVKPVAQVVASSAPIG